MAESWLPACVRRDGPGQKQGYGHIPSRSLGEIEGICAHSMEGSLAAALGELDNPARLASWTFSNPRAGNALQHYPLESVTWGSGSPEANRRFVSIEHEGWAGEPLTENQITNLVMLTRTLTAEPRSRTTNLREHNEMTAYGAQPTACPSGRIPWAEIIAELEDDMGVTQDDIDRWNDTDIAVKAVLLAQAKTDEAIKEVLANLNGRLAALEDHPESEESIAELDKRLDEAAKALAGQ
jgi:hypothetical protein